MDQFINQTEKGSTSQNVFMYPQFLIDNLFSKYKSYQLLNASSKEFKSIESIISNKLIIMEQWKIDKYDLSDKGITIKKVTIDDKALYFVFGIFLNENIDFSDEHYSYIESYFDKKYDPTINIMNKAMIVFGDVLRGILMNPRIIYTDDDLSKLDSDMIKNTKSRYLDLVTLNTRSFEEIFKFIYGQQFNNIISKNDYIIDYCQFDILIYNIYYLALNKIFNDNDIILAKDLETIMKNIIASIYTLDNLDKDKLRYLINSQDNPLNDLMIELNKYILNIKPVNYAKRKFEFCKLTSDPIFVNSNPINQMNIILETEKEL